MILACKACGTKNEVDPAEGSEFSCGNCEATIKLPNSRTTISTVSNMAQKRPLQRKKKKKKSKSMQKTMVLWICGIVGLCAIAFGVIVIRGSKKNFSNTVANSPAVRMEQQLSVEDASIDESKMPFEIVDLREDPARKIGNGIAYKFTVRSRLENNSDKLQKDINLIIHRSEGRDNNFSMDSIVEGGWKGAGEYTFWSPDKIGDYVLGKFTIWLSQGPEGNYMTPIANGKRAKEQRISNKISQP